MTFRYLEHTADVGVEVTSPTIEGAFSDAAVALFGIMTDTSDFSPSESLEVSVSGEDPKSLLYSWLEELIFIFDTTSLVVVRADVADASFDPFTVRATLRGEKFDDQIHETRTGVKAITYHGMEISGEKGKFLLRYFVDI